MPSTFKDRLSNFIDVRNERNPLWIPARLRGLVRRVSGGDSWTAQMLRGLLWQYRWFVGLALVANLGAALFEGSTMVILTMALQALSGEFTPGQSVLIAPLEGLFTQARDDYGLNGLFFILIGLAVTTQLLRSGFYLLSQIATSYLVAWQEGNLRRRVYEQMLAISYPQISRYKIGELNSYFEQITSVREIVAAIGRLFNDLLMVSAYVLVLFWLSWQMTLLAIVGMLLLSFALKGLRARIHETAKQELQATVDFNKEVLEGLRGLRLIHAFGRARFMAERIGRTIFEAVRLKRVVLVQHAFINPLIQSATIIAVALFLIGGYLLLGQEPGVIARLLTFVFVLYRLLPFNSGINHNVAVIESYWPAANRVAQLLRPDDKQYVQSGSLLLDDPVDSIELRQVSLRYLGSEQYALRQLSLTIRGGAMVAFVGASGAGKSSIVNLFLRLYDPTAGAIFVNGRPLSDYQLNAWREKLGVVDQDTFIFNSSVADNIRFGRLTATDGEIIEAAKAANAHDFIVALEDGYQTVVGDRGMRLSGGQRQRIAIARAILRDPSVLIFDEATSSLDSQTEQLIQQALATLRVGRTLILIAHRLSTVVDADRIYVLRNGQIVEDGSHRQLVQRQGIYATMWHLQADGREYTDPTGKEKTGEKMEAV